MAGRQAGDLLANSAYPRTKLVLRIERRYRPQCGAGGAICSRRHAVLRPRRWADLPWAEHPVGIEATPVRVKCRKCRTHPVEMVSWADAYQRQTPSRRRACR